MSRMRLAAVRWVIIVAFSGAGAGCRSVRAEELASRVRLLYTGSLSTTVEQPEAEAECGPEQVTFETSGYVAIDREESSARLEGFGCSIGLAEPSGAEFSANAQACIPSGVVNFKGLGLERLDIESFTFNLNDKTALWRARAWRELPSGRVSYCFDLTGSIEQR